MKCGDAKKTGEKGVSFLYRYIALFFALIIEALGTVFQHNVALVSQLRQALPRCPYYDRYSR